MKNIDILKTIYKELDNSESLITCVTDRKGYYMRYPIDSTKIHNELSRLPETMFETGTKKTIQWYLENRGGRQLSDGNIRLTMRECMGIGERDDY